MKKLAGVGFSLHEVPRACPCQGASGSNRVIMWPSGFLMAAILPAATNRMGPSISAPMGRILCSVSCSSDTWNAKKGEYPVVVCASLRQEL